MAETGAWLPDDPAALGGVGVRAMRAHRVDLGARRWWVLGALVLAMLAIGLDVTVLSVALPTLAGALRASTAQLQWFVAAYTLVLAAALLPGGLLAGVSEDLQVGWVFLLVRQGAVVLLGV